MPAKTTPAHQTFGAFLAMLFFGGLAGLFLMHLIESYNLDQALEQRGHSVSGEVVRKDFRNRGYDIDYTFPVPHPSGSSQWITASQRLSRSEQKIYDFAKGDSVTVLYLPENPGISRIETIRLGPRLGGVFLCSSAFGLMVLFFLFVLGRELADRGPKVAPNDRRRRRRGGWTAPTIQGRIRPAAPQDAPRITGHWKALWSVLAIVTLIISGVLVSAM